MAQYNHEVEMAERYAKELDDAAEILQHVHPVGVVKAIGRLEIVAALRELFPVRLDQEGRDVFSLPGLCDEGDTFEKASVTT